MTFWRLSRSCIESGGAGRVEAGPEAIQAVVRAFAAEVRTLADSGGAPEEMEPALLARERRTAVAVGTGMIVLGAEVLVAGIVNLAMAPAMAAARGNTLGFPIPLSRLPPWMAIGVLATQNWLSFVAIQLAFGAIVLVAGIGFLRWRSWARGIVEGLGWIGTAPLAVTVLWVGRSILRSPSDHLLGLRAGLETLPV